MVLNYCQLNAALFWLPMELTRILIAGVYYPPSSNATQALEIITAHIDQPVGKHPKAVIMVLGDFNHTATATHSIGSEQRNTA